MTELAFAGIAELSRLLDQKKITPIELAHFYADRFSRYDAELGSALEIFPISSAISSFEGKLSGIPGLFKDNICQRGRTVSCGSKILADYTAPYDATVAERAKKAGATLLGRANCDEFAMGSSGETSAYKKTTNPWDLSRVSGGSSSGSVAAVAAGLIPWALGTETGGSVRLPAALCGVVGLKPTYGRISRYGVVAYGSSLDQIGIVTRSVADSATVLEVLAGHDEKDSTSSLHTVSAYASSLTGRIKPGLKIGVIENALYAEGIDPDVTQALENVLKEYQRLGATLVRISLPAIDYGAAAYCIISRAEAASNLARFDGIRYGYRTPHAATLAEVYAQSRGEGFGKEVRRRILIGNYVLSKGYAEAYYMNATTVRGIMRHDFSEAFTSVDLLFAPVSPAGAFAFGAFDQNRLHMDLQDYFVAPANLVGIPAISVPCGFTSQQLPIGFQLMGTDWSEELLLASAYAYEQATPWHTMNPVRYR